MLQPTPDTERLDDHLLEVVRALHGAVKRGIARKDDPQTVDRAIQNCEEILEVIMAGRVDEWLH